MPAALVSSLGALGLAFPADVEPFTLMRGLAWTFRDTEADSDAARTRIRRRLRLARSERRSAPPPVHSARGAHRPTMEPRAQRPPPLPVHSAARRSPPRPPRAVRACPCDAIAVHLLVAKAS